MNKIYGFFNIKPFTDQFCSNYVTTFIGKYFFLHFILKYCV